MSGLDTPSSLRSAGYSTSEGSGRASAGFSTGRLVEWARGTSARIETTPEEALR